MKLGPIAVTTKAGAAVVLLVGVAGATMGTTTSGCSDGTVNGAAVTMVGQSSMRLALPDGVSFDTVTWTITNALEGFTPRAATVAVAGAPSIGVVIDGLPQGPGYTITLTATDSNQDHCTGSGDFSVMAGAVSEVGLTMICTAPAAP